MFWSRNDLINSHLTLPYRCLLNSVIRTRVDNICYMKMDRHWVTYFMSSGLSGFKNLELHCLTSCLLLWWNVRARRQFWNSCLEAAKVMFNNNNNKCIKVMFNVYSGTGNMMGRKIHWCIRHRDFGRLFLIGLCQPPVLGRVKPPTLIRLGYRIRGANPAQ